MKGQFPVTQADIGGGHAIEAPQMFGPGDIGDLFDDPALLDRFYVIFLEPHDWMLPKERSASSFIRAIAGLDRDFLIAWTNGEVQDLPPAAQSNRPARPGPKKGTRVKTAKRGKS